MPPDPDLVLVRELPAPCLTPARPPSLTLTPQIDFNPNDGDEHGDAPKRRGHERLLRKLLAYETRPALVEVVFCIWSLDWME